MWLNSWTPQAVFNKTSLRCVVAISGRSRELLRHRRSDNITLSRQIPHMRWLLAKFVFPLVLCIIDTQFQRESGDWVRLCIV
jgi:hypothetical protein